MGDMFRKVRSGSPLRIPAAAYNAFVDAAVDLRRRERTTNAGPAYLYRNDSDTGFQSIRFRLRGSPSNRDAIGAVVQVFDDSGRQTQMVRSGSSYLSASDLALTFGLGKSAEARRVVVHWPSGRQQEARNVKAGLTYLWIEGRTPDALPHR